MTFETLMTRRKEFQMQEYYARASAEKTLVTVAATSSRYWDAGVRGLPGGDFSDNFKFSNRVFKLGSYGASWRLCSKAGRMMAARTSISFCHNRRHSSRVLASMSPWEVSSSNLGRYRSTAF